MDLDLDELSFYGKKIKELIDIQGCSIVSMLLGMETNGNLPRGSLAEVAEKFQTSRATVSRLWGQAKLSRSKSKLVEKEIL